MKHRTHGALLAGLLVVTGLIAACTDEHCTPIPFDEGALLDEAWSLFEAGDRKQAAERFQEVIEHADDISEGQVGLAWTYLSLDSTDLAIELFSKAAGGRLVRDRAGTFAGRSIAYKNHEPVDWTLAITYADTASRKLWSQEYCRHIPSLLTPEHMNLVMAQAYFALGNFTAAASRVESLNGTVLDPESESYVEDLLAEIQRIGTDMKLDYFDR